MRRYNRYPPEVDMSIDTLARVTIAVALVLALLFGFNVTE